MDARVATATSTPTQATLDWAGRAITLELRWVGTAGSDAPLVVFLHEGLGSVAMWKDFPDAFCAATGTRGLVYSRPGYGASTPRETDERWDVDYMHRQAREVLPALLDTLGVEQPVWLLGHSDGGSIALIFAAAHPQRVAGLIVCAPHLYVEDCTVDSIAQARDAYGSTPLRDRLSRYHADVDSAFWGWNHIWLHPPFRDWNIEDVLPQLRCPILAVQGLDDEYGSLDQIRDIRRGVPDATQVELLELPDCGHSAHKDQPQALIARARDFMQRHGVTPPAPAMASG